MDKHGAPPYKQAIEAQVDARTLRRVLAWCNHTADPSKHSATWVRDFLTPIRGTQLFRLGAAADTLGIDPLTHAVSAHAMRTTD